MGGEEPQQALGARLMWPGLMLQNLTTREPDDDQLEVAIRLWRPCWPRRSRLRPASLPIEIVA